MIETINLSKKYGAFLALDQLSLKINPGEIFCLLGANGAGKSTTIGLLLNFIAPTGGQALINGIDVSKKPVESKQHISYIPENLMLYPQLTGLENLDFFCRLSGKRYQHKQLRELLLDAGIPEAFIGRKVKTYSKGMRQKVGIALTMAKDAKILLLDEPTSGLDPQASNEFARLLKRMSKKKVAILMATHDLFRAKATATHIGIMKKGSIVQSLNQQEIAEADLESIYLNLMNQQL